MAATGGVESSALEAAPSVPEAPAGIPAEARTAGGLLDSVLGEKVRAKEIAPLLDRFLAELSLGRCLSLWTGRPATEIVGQGKEQLLAGLARDIARLDAILSAQVNAILHHPRFQQLEASWRGLHFLVEQADMAEDVKIRILSATWKELVRDLERAVEFDQSQLFRKIYSDEFGTPGGEPFGLLLGDYEIWPRPSAAHPLNDVQRQQLRARLIEAGYGNVNIHESVEPDLLGGLVVRVGARLYDTSLKSRLQRLQYAMKGAA